jgi:CubicO group peptidase (beta-lactamase class C family)
MPVATAPFGIAEPAFAPVRDVFEQVLVEQDRARATGAAVAVWHEGRWVVDLWGGYSDTARTAPWTRDTLVMPYSVTKPFAAVCALVLADRGGIDLDAPLTTYWPELTARTTMRQVLCHQSGLALLEDPAPEEAFYDWDLMCSLVAAQPPLWEPGTACGESALLYGHQIGEVIRRVDGRTLGTFLREEVCGPQGIEFAVGLRDEELSRVADLTGFDASFRRRGEDGSPVMRRALANPPGALDPDVVNGVRWRTAEIAAVNGHGTARGVAGLLVAVEQGRLLSPGMKRAMTSVAASGTDRVLDRQAAWGLGVGIDDDGYGMGGVGGSVAWCSTEGAYVLGFVTGWIADHDRMTRIDNAVRGCLGLPPL